MKKILLSAVALLSLTAVTAQTKTVGEELIHFDRVEMQDRSDDTLSFSDCSATGYTVYTAGPGNGYVMGTNAYNDIAKGNKITFAGSASIVGVYAWYGQIETTSGASIYVATIHDGSEALLGTSATHTIADIDTTTAGAAGWLEYTFTTPVTVTSDFYAMVSVDAPASTNADTVALVCSVSGCGGNAYEIGGDGTWYDVDANWGGFITEVSLVVLVNDLSFTGLFDTEAYKFGTYTANNTLFLNGINDDVLVNEVVIYDMNGKAVKTISVADQFTSYSFDISDITTGNYVISLNTNKGTVGQKVNIK
jgi:hypothetical protein